jgi:hypothetical protein
VVLCDALCEVYVGVDNRVGALGLSSVTIVLQGRYKSVTRVLQGRYKSVIRVSQECYRSVTGMLQECYKSVTRVLQGWQYQELLSCMIAWAREGPQEVGR